MTSPGNERELIVGDDGSIPAAQLERLGLRPGAHLRVVVTADESSDGSIAGALADFPDLAWEDFERASELARHDANAS